MNQQTAISVETVARRILGACTLSLACASAAAAFAQTAPGATATFINEANEQIGNATLTQMPRGVLIDVDVSGLAAGEHGFHIHETGNCDAANGFQSAGGHYAPRQHAHGYKAADGEHAGDMPNQFVGADGILRAQAFNPNVSLEGGDAALLDADGSAVVIHAGADDYESQPAGSAGSRIACAVIE